MTCHLHGSISAALYGLITETSRNVAGSCTLSYAHLL